MRKIDRRKQRNGIEDKKKRKSINLLVFSRRENRCAEESRGQRVRET